MANDEVYRQTRKRVGPDDISPQSPFSEENPMERIRQVQEAVANHPEHEGEMPQHFNPMQNPDQGFNIQGNMPPEFQRVLQQRASMQGKEAPQFGPGDDDDDEDFTPPPVVAKKAKKAPKADRTPMRATGSEELESLLERLSEHSQWEQIQLPSKGKFYDSIPGILHLRPMTGEEEQILATPRYVRKGKAIDMIFERCIREPITTSELLSSDRTYLLIYLRGISYTPEYDVEVKCPECSMKFSHTIDLNGLEVDFCPEDFSPEDLSGVLPTTGFRYQFHLASGDDEQAVTRYRENFLKEFGDSREDDTLLYRTALLLDYIEGVKERNELNVLLKKLPINDVAHLRNVINDPPFGVNTEIGVSCAYCSADFEIDLPLEANFFFPRKKKDRTRA